MSTLAIWIVVTLFLAAIIAWRTYKWADRRNAVICDKCGRDCREFYWGGGEFSYTECDDCFMVPSEHRKGNASRPYKPDIESMLRDEADYRDAGKMLPPRAL